MKSNFNNLPSSFYYNFGYLSNLGSLALLSNFNSEYTEEMLVKFYKQIEEAPQVKPDIYGLSGLGILLNYLSKVDKDRFDEYNEEFVNDFSDVILEASVAMAKELEYDTFVGLVCTLNFFIVTEQKDSVLKVTDMLQKVTTELYKKNELNNLGISHGVCGIIAVMAKAILFLQKEDLQESKLKKYKETLQLITTHVIKQKGEIGNFFFPYTVGDNKSRLAWCYGDFSVCIALTWAALALPNSKKEIDDLVKETINNAIQIQDEDRCFRINQETKEFDLALCHGVAGVYLVFKRLYKFYPSEELASEIKRLRAKLDKEVEKGLDNIIFPIVVSKQENLAFEWKQNLSFLEGLSGFLAAYHDDELVKGWDAPLLTDF